jgi:hypothetical protein
VKKILLILAGLMLATVSLGPAPASSTPERPANLESVERPTHNPDNLAAFTCAVNRPDPAGPMDFRSGTVNHSHENVDKRVTDPLGGTQITWYDCEVFNNPGLDGCNYAALYINADRNDTGVDFGILTPALNVSCFN